MNDKERALERYLCKTDLYYLGSEYLGYDFIEPIHRPVCDFFVKKDPNRPFEEQDIIHDRLLLDPREHYKTTIDVCDIVQWILCFPDIRILVFSGTEELVKRIVELTKRHFQFNDKLRDLFPEHAIPPSDKGVFEFTTPARTNYAIKEPTVSCSTIESTSTGGHYEVMKFDDIVTPKNVTTDEQIEKVKNRVADVIPLVVIGGYRDFIGTRYTHDDAYGQIIDRLENVKKTVIEIPYGSIMLAEEEESNWKVFQRRLCTLPLDEKSEFLFPFHKNGRVNFNLKAVKKRLKEMGMEKFGCQYLNDPTWGAKNSFSEELIESIQIPEQFIPMISKGPMDGQVYKNAQVFITVDLAFTQNTQSDLTSIAVGAYAKTGVLYLIDLIAGKFSSDEFLMHLLTMVRKWYPFLSRIGIEETGGAKLVLPALRMAGLHNVMGKIDWWPTNPTRSKIQHIMALLPLMKTRKFYINKDIPQIKDIVKAFTRYNGKSKDDIPDSIAMLLWYQSQIDVWHPQLYADYQQTEMVRQEPNVLGYGFNG